MATEEFYLNKRRRLSWVEESTYGDGGDMAANGEVVGINHTFEPGEWSRGWSEIINNGSDSRQIQDWVEGVKDFPWVHKFNPVNWKFLKYAFDVVDAGAGPYTHTFTESGCLKSFDYENIIFANTPKLMRLKGGYVSTTTITWSKQTSPNDGFVEISQDCNAQDLDPLFAVPSIVAAITQKPFRAHQCLFTIEGTQIDEVNNGEISIEQGLDPSNFTYASASFDRTRGQPIPQTLRITGTINVNLKDETLLDLFKADNVLTGVNNLLIERTVDDNIQLNFDKLVIVKGVDDGADVEGPTNADIVFSVRLSNIVVTDNVATY